MVRCEAGHWARDADAEVVLGAVGHWVAAARDWDVSLLALVPVFDGDEVEVDAALNLDRVARQPVCALVRADEAVRSVAPSSRCRTPCWPRSLSTDR